MLMTYHTDECAEMVKNDTSMCEFGGRVLGTARLTSLNFIKTIS